MKKLMVIGIDGVPFELIQKYADQGIMPNTHRLVKKHRLIRTKVPLPEISSVSWTSFMTGMNPGQHGIYGFMDVNPRNYAFRFPSFKALPVKTTWERIGESGKRSVIINLPGTYPARPLNGVLISGFVALDLKKSVFPEHYLPLLEDMDYRVDVDTVLARTEKKLFLNELHDVLLQRYKLYKELQVESWDLFYFIITGTDRLHHFFFNAWDDENAPFHNEFIDYYRQLDSIIGEITGEMEKQGIPFIILSDHGFVKLKKEVYISQYLKEWGYLDFTEQQPKNLKSITPDSRVFALDPSRLYINLKDKYGRGCVETGDYPKLCEEIKQRFLDLTIDGQKVIQKVYHKEEIYSGQYVEQAPDLVLLSHYGFDLKAGITKDHLNGKTFFEGMHSWDNAVLIDTFGFHLDEHPYIYSIGRQLENYFE